MLVVYDGNARAFQGNCVAPSNIISKIYVMFKTRAAVFYRDLDPIKDEL